jgi:hypothetical protein
MPRAKEPPPTRVGNVADRSFRDCSNQDKPRKKREPDPTPVGLTPADKGFADFTEGDVPEWVEENMRLQGGIPRALRDDHPEDRIPPAPGFRECRYVPDCKWVGKRGNNYKQHLRTAHNQNDYQSDNLAKARAARKANLEKREQPNGSDLGQHADHDGDHNAD